MFTMFLRQKLSSLRPHTPKPGTVSRVVPGNRRFFHRYAVQQQGLKLVLNEDILLIRDISAKGLCCHVSPRVFEQLAIGDTYAVKIHTDRRHFNLNLKVSWKNTTQVGFEVVDSTPEMLAQLRSTLLPIEYAQSLKEVAPSSVKQSGQYTKIWLHGDFDSDLFVHVDQQQKIVSWHLRFGQEYLEWQASTGATTGKIATSLSAKPLQIAMTNPELVPDVTVNHQRRQFAIDVCKALQHPLRSQLLATIGG